MVHAFFHVANYSVVSPEMMLPVPCSLPSLDVLAMCLSWWAWATRMPTSVTRPSPREVSHVSVMVGMGNKDAYVGEEAQSKRG